MSNTEIRLSLFTIFQNVLKLTNIQMLYDASQQIGRQFIYNPRTKHWTTSFKRFEQSKNWTIWI